ncbi:hypothetical protein TRVL_05891 [Trypanosoma vivax]|nr:hypothetical protein TRVL_05891 [Trypanosoma vivax]
MGCLTFAAPLVSQTRLAAPVTDQKYNDLELSRHLHYHTEAVLDPGSVFPAFVSVSCLRSMVANCVSWFDTQPQVCAAHCFRRACLFAVAHFFTLCFLSSGWNRSCDVALHRKTEYATCSTHRHTHAQRVVFSSFVYARSNPQ